MSFATADAAHRLTPNLRPILHYGGFRLSKFVSNNPATLTTLPEEDREIIQNTTKVLGQTFVFLVTRSQLQRRKQSTRRKHFDNCSALCPPFSIPLDCSLPS